MKIFWLFVLQCAAGAFGQSCPEVLATLNLTDTASMVAHATHSLTLNMIRHYFKPEAGEANNITTVNLDRGQENHLHDHAPFIVQTLSIDYPPFFELDNILSNIDNRKYGIKRANFKDEVAHFVHMHYLWETASKFYKMLVETPPEDDVCPCFLETYQDDIMANLLWIAQQIRTPGQIDVGGGSNQTRREYVGLWVGLWVAVYRGELQVAAADMESEAADMESEAADMESEAVRTGGTATDNHGLTYHNIKDEESWEQWKMTVMKEPHEGHHDNMAQNMAYYMYCMLN